MKTILKTENIGNTFIGLVCTAFSVKCSDIKMDPVFNHSGCGTIEVKGCPFDWFDKGDSVIFLEAK